jgi:hypothetical protein
LRLVERADVVMRVTEMYEQLEPASIADRQELDRAGQEVGCRREVRALLSTQPCSS